MKNWIKLAAWLTTGLVLIGSAMGLMACAAPAGREPSGAAEEPAPTAADAAQEEEEILALGDLLPRLDIDMPVEPADREGMFDTPPPMTLDTSLIHYAVFHTEQGPITVQLFADRAPQTVNNFVHLARTGYFDDTTFHRVIADFMAQGGDPTGTGRGGPGYQFADEFAANLNFERPGLLAMANAGPHTNGSQFFITFAPTPHLNQKHTIFGEVIEGMDAALAIRLRDPMSASALGDRIERIDIHASAESILPPPAPTPTPLPAPTPYAPHEALAEDARPLAALAPEDRIGYFNTAPDMIIDTGQAYTATVETSVGTLTFDLWPELAPGGVNNFVILARLGYFDGLSLFPTNDGMATVLGLLDLNRIEALGYALPAEANYEENTAEPGLLLYVPHPDSSEQIMGSVLFITLAPVESSNLAQFTVIGAVSGGMDILPQLAGNAEITISTATVVSN